MKEHRTDWLMRQFCDQIAELMRAGMKMSAAIMRMTERGVPRHVQWRIVDATRATPT